MIECSDENIYYIKRRKRKKKSFRLFLIFLIIFGVVLYFRLVVSSNVSNICSEYVYSYATESVNNAILSSLNNDLSYSNLINIEKNQSGEIVLMSTDSYKINYINRQIIDLTTKSLKNKLKKGIPIPILAFTGIELISGFGSEVNYKSVSISSVESNFESKFESVGINQTLHSIYIIVKSKVSVHFPLRSDTKVCETKILVSETILVGKVPEIYLNGGLFN